MMIFLFLPIINLFVFIYTSVDAQGMESETFVLNIDADAHPNNYLQLPLKYIPTLNDQNVIRACPAEKDQDKKNLSKISNAAMIYEIFHETMYCLFRKSFFEGQKKTCTEEVKPLLRAEIDNRTNQQRLCGFSSTHKLYSFGFYYCGEPGRLAQLENRKIRNHPLKFELETLFLPIYELCVDLSSRRALWTKHSIMTPAIFQDFDERNELMQAEGDLSISIDALLFKGKTYESMAKKYKNQNVKNPKMNPNFMVPGEHIAVKMWRKTVNHYIIVAPFLDKLQQLMTGVNEVIKKLALILHSKNQLLTIYTRVIDASSWGSFSRTLISNTWYKLLHEKTHNSAVLIVLQNTPEGPPGLETKLCETRMKCDMSSWFNDIPQDNLQYAACCIPSTNEIKKLFSVHLDIAGGLDIDTELSTNIINKNQPRKSNRPSSSGDSKQLGNIMQHQQDGSHQTAAVDSQVQMEE